MRRSLSFDDKVAQLANQVTFLNRSISTYDAGNQEEFQRIAVCLRILLISTRNMVALLPSLGLRRLLSSTDLPTSRGEITAEGLSIVIAPPMFATGILGIAMEHGTLEYFARLKEDELKEMNIEDWLDQYIFVEDNVPLTRNELIRSVADQDGGAHVDPTVPEAYYRSRFEGHIAWKISSNGQELDVVSTSKYPELIRQVSFELMTSIKDFQPQEVI